MKRDQTMEEGRFEFMFLDSPLTGRENLNKILNISKPKLSSRNRYVLSGLKYILYVEST